MESNVANVDTSGEILIKRDWLKSIALAALSFCLVVASWYGIQLEPHSFYEYKFHSGSFVMLPFFSAFLPFVLYRLVIPIGAPVRLSPAGFTDLRVSRKIVPWNEIRNVTRKKDFLALTLNLKFARAYPPSITQRVIKRFVKSAGPSHMLIADWCLFTNRPELSDLVNAYRDAHSR